MIRFTQIERQEDFGYPYAFIVPGYTFGSHYGSEECLKFWEGVQWCEDHLGSHNQGTLYRSGTWTISSPQKPRLFILNAEDAFAFKMKLG